MVQKIRHIIFCFFLAIGVGQAQHEDSAFTKIKLAENDIKTLCKQAFYSKIESERIKANKEIIANWNKIIHFPEVLTYPFDSLKKDISVLQAEDGKFKLITWNIFKDDGTYFYFGFLAVNQSKRVKTGLFKHDIIPGFETFQLQDKSLTVKTPESYIGSVDKWFGMLYYKVIACDDFYTLLGFDPNDKLTQRKFIDVLYFKADGSPVFGKDVFRVPKKNPKRMMFEYGSGVTMSLRYDEAGQRITFSHLSAKEEGNMLDGQFQFYGPDGSFDALVLRKDKWKNVKWQLVEDIDARNIKSKNDNAEKPNPKKQKPIYKAK